MLFIADYFLLLGQAIYMEFAHLYLVGSYRKKQMYDLGL